jgi:hypothetical protein
VLFKGGSELVWPQARMIAATMNFIRLRLNLRTPTSD